MNGIQVKSIEMDVGSVIIIPKEKSKFEVKVRAKDGFESIEISTPKIGFQYGDNVTKIMDVEEFIEKLNQIYHVLEGISR